jgi:hypothetical protein
MNKFKILAAVAVAGIVGMSIQAAPAGYCSANIKATVLSQNDSVVTTNGTTITAKITTEKVKITNKDILGLIADEFGSLPDGAQLVTYGYGSDFVVLDKDGNVLISDASSSVTSYRLYVDSDNYVVAGKASSSPTQMTQGIKETVCSVLRYNNWNGSSWFMIAGVANVNVSMKLTISTATLKESYKFTGFGEGYMDGYDIVIPSAKFSGSGKDLIF